MRGREYLKTWALLLCLSLLVGLGGLVTSCTTAPITGRRQLILISPSEELQLGMKEFEKLKKELPISTNKAAQAMVERVGRRIAAVADLPNAEWEFVLFENKEPNAFCLPGGKVGVFTGILPIAKNEAGLATVIGHEVGHAIAHHGAERITEAMLLSTGGKLLAGALDLNDPRTLQAFSLAYGVGTQVLVALPHSRLQEEEADHIGLILMARAGYDPKEAIRFWERFAAWSKKHGGSHLPVFLRTHPLDEQRIENLKRLLPIAEREYELALQQGQASTTKTDNRKR